MESITQNILLEDAGVTLSIRREDLLHPYISGNKFRKLKYNLIKAQAENAETLLTFGGAFSNHIVAVAAAAAENGLRSIGIIRGDEIKSHTTLNPTLSLARKFGMELVFVSREEYRMKSAESFVCQLNSSFGDFYLIPEGGTNGLAVKGCEEILTDRDTEFNYICCAVGTGGTLSGIINSSTDRQTVLGFPVLNANLESDVSKFAKKDNWKLINDYHIGGYAKISAELITFINDFNTRYSIPLDPVYTGKLLFGVMDMIANGYFVRGSKVLAIHTGGLQGIQGMNNKLRNKNLPLIESHD